MLRIVEDQGPSGCSNDGGFDAAFGGARRDEEKSRAKERIYSFRNAHGQWNPKNQRPELWNNFNGRIDKGESIRVFPLSNWTELDVWLYIRVEHIPIVPLYYAKVREVAERNGSLILIHSKNQLLPGEQTQHRTTGSFILIDPVSNATVGAGMIREELQASGSHGSGSIEALADFKNNRALREQRY